MPVPIWKDYEVGFGNVDAADYTIETGGVEIYSGHAVRRPDQAQLLVRINDVCADYLSHALPVIGSLGATPDPCIAEFTVIDDGGNTVDTVEFIADWSYDYNRVSTAISEPVNGRVAENQTLILSTPSGANVAATLRYRSGSTSSVSVSGSGADAQSVSIPLSGYAGLASVTVGGITYNVVPACHEFALLYVNAFGGWDTLLMEGRPSKEDGYDRKTMRRVYDNTSPSARGTAEYVNEITRTHTLRTGWLTDIQAARMHHVVGSPLVYLYDIVDGRAIPVVITDTSFEYRTYKGNGARLVRYDITAAEATDRMRR